MSNEWWSYILTAVGITGFFLAGRKIWWSWYINIFCQVLWFAYAIVTTQYGFIAAALLYTVVFGKNAWQWSREHFKKSSEDIPAHTLTSAFMTADEARQAFIDDNYGDDRPLKLVVNSDEFRAAVRQTQDLINNVSDVLPCLAPGAHSTHYWMDYRGVHHCYGVKFPEVWCGHLTLHEGHDWDGEEHKYHCTGRSWFDAE